MRFRLHTYLVVACLMLCLSFHAKAQRVALGEAINTDLYDESAPLLSADGSQFFFWSSGRPDGYGIQDIYYTQRDSLGEFLPATHLGPPLNDPECNIALSVTPDGNLLFVYRQNRRPGYSDLAISRKFPQGWGPPSNLKIEGFESAGAGLTAFLAADGQTLLLSTYSDQGYGREDLFVSFFDSKEETWSSPLNLGAILNTEGSEVTPFLAPDGITLYFSSNQHTGLGGDDIFVSRRLDDSWTRWSPPQNLGAPINSPGNDYYFKFAATDATVGYFVSDHDRPTRDIFRVPIPPALRPQPVLQVKGRVLDQESQLPLAARIIYENLLTGESEGTALTDTVSGEYRILLPAGKNIGFVAQAKGYMAISENLEVTLPKGQQFAQKTLDLKLARLRIGQQIRLNNLFFHIGSASLRRESYPELNRLVSVLLENPGMVIEVGGHTDNTGSDAVNQPLSEARARAVIDYLLQKGIAPEQASAKGYGSSKPVADNATATGRQQNRRVEITILEFPKQH